MQDKYSWKDSTVDEVDWQVHGGALRGLPAHIKKTTTQFIHEWIPTNAHPGRAQQTEARNCPYCLEAEETQTHYLQCNHTLTDKLWIEYKAKLKATLVQGKTSQILQALLLQAVSDWRTTKQPEATTTLPESAIPLSQAQSAIGWDQIQKGRLSTKWVDMQNEYLRQRRQAPKGEQWATRVVKAIWISHYQIWKSRCAQQHGESPIQIRERKLRALTPRVHALYGYRNRLDKYDRNILNRPITELLDEPVYVIEEWVATNERAILEGVRREEERSKYETKSIKTFYNVIPPTTERKLRDSTKRTIRAMIQEAYPQKPIKTKIPQVITEFFQKHVKKIATIPTPPINKAITADYLPP
jgi:hypothetical protein